MSPGDEELGPLLASLHRRMRDELEGVLLSACDPDAGIWERWAAVRVVENDARSCLLAERELVQAVVPRLSRASAEHLWAIGELLQILGARLAELGRLPQASQEFGSTAAKYRLALDYWCGNVEAFVGPLPVRAVPAALVEQIARYSEELAASGV